MTVLFRKATAPGLLRCLPFFIVFSQAALGGQVVTLDEVTTFDARSESLAYAKSYWQNGSLLVVDPISLSSPAGFLAFRKDGALAAEPRISFDGAQTVRLRHAAAANDGGFAAAGSAHRADGGYANFIAWFDSRGEISHVVDTGHFSAARITFIADGRLWAFGPVLHKDIGVRDRRLSDDTLRQYAIDGRLVRSMWPGEDYWRLGRHAAAKSHITAVGDTLGVYINDAAEWVEVGPNGNVTRWAGVPSSLEVMGLGALNDGSVYVSYRTTPRALTQGASQTWGYSKLDKADGRWIPVVVDFPESFADSYPVIAGSDGDRLLAPSARPTYAWLSLAEPVMTGESTDVVK